MTINRNRRVTNRSAITLLTLDGQLVVNSFGRIMSPDGSKISNTSRYLYIIPKAIINLMGRLYKSTTLDTVCMI